MYPQGLGMASKVKDRNSLYETDFFAWTQEQAQLLRERKFDDIDLENLAEEVETVGRSDKHQIESRLEVLIAHLLKWRFQPGSRSPGWRRTIREQRSRIGRVVMESPSLADYPLRARDFVYNAARSAAAEETGIDYTLFPETCPYAIEQILDPEFFPLSLDDEAGAAK